MQLHEFADQSQLNHALSQRLQQLIAEAIAKRGQCYLGISGGKTPIPLFNFLASLNLPWSKVTFVLVDERCLPPTHQDSNEHMVRKNLLTAQAAAASLINPYQEVEDKTATIRDLIAHLPQFDAVLLGMGEDGHTASLFPDAPELPDALEDNAPATLKITPRLAPYVRISLSKARLLNSREIFLHITGEKKLAVINEARTKSSSQYLPISAFLNTPNVDLQTYYAP